MNDIDNMLLNRINEIGKDVKEILQKIPTLQSIEKCEKNRIEIRIEKKRNIKYNITTGITLLAAISAVIVAILK